MRVVSKRRLINTSIIVNDETVDYDFTRQVVFNTFKESGALRKIHRLLIDLDTETKYVLKEDNRRIINRYDIVDYNPDELELLFVIDRATAVIVISNLKTEIPKVFDMSECMIGIQTKAIYDILSSIAIMNIQEIELMEIIKNGGII